MGDGKANRLRLSAVSIRRYGSAQTIILIVFTLVYFFGPGPPMFPPGGVLAWIGVILCIGGLALMLVAIAALREVIQVAPDPREGGHLVMSGPYRWLRHPIYTAILVLVIGLFLRRATVPVAIVTAIVIVFLVAKTRYEEKLLLERYPDYAAYRQRTWGLLPGVRS
jgi:protein-S-isoprenylcysteine O-methyltransferase Ste14